MEVYKAYAGKKDFALLEGHHNSVRSIFLHNKVGQFFENTLFEQSLSSSRASCGYLTPRLIEPGDILGDDSEPTEIDDSLKNFCAGDQDEIIPESDSEDETQNEAAQIVYTSA